MDCHIPVVSESIAILHQVNTENFSLTHKVNAFASSRQETRTQGSMINFRLNLPGNAKRKKSGGGVLLFVGMSPTSGSQ